VRQDLICGKEKGPNFWAELSKKETGPNLRKKGRNFRKRDWTKLPVDRQNLTSGREAGPLLPEEKHDLIS
jgi:hypothetical protein